MPFNQFSHGFKGLAATLVGNGIGRFGYIALMPILIQSGWLSQAHASYLGVATLAGYIFGVPLAIYLNRYISDKNVVRLAMLACSLSYLCCAFEQAHILWFYQWRFAAGVGGAILMVVPPAMILKTTPKDLRGRVSGLIFTGIGLGAMLSGGLIPQLVDVGLSFTWISLGALCLLLTVLTWNSWDTSEVTEVMGNKEPVHAVLSPIQKRASALILLAYFFNAVGYLPHSLFWVDFLVREVQLDITTGGLLWALFGIGAMTGPLIAGYMGDFLGFRLSLLIGFTIKGIGAFMPIMSYNPIILGVSAFLVGVFTPGIVTLVSSYTLFWVGPAQHRVHWGRMTFSFAVSQALLGFIMAFLSIYWGSYIPLFLISACALAISVLCIASITKKSSQEQVLT